MFPAPHSMNKHKGAIVGMAAAALCFGYASDVGASDPAQQNFPESAWSAELLDFIAMGPAILPANFETGVKPPNKNNSDETQEELKYLIQLKEKRTTSTLNKIQAEHTELKSLDIFVLEGLVSIDGRPNTQEFFDMTEQDVSYFIMRDKKHFARIRPSSLNVDIQPVVDVPPHAAYPSGHATQSYFVGHTLSQLNPAKAESYMDLARDIAHRREIAGLHYPSDSAAGLELAKAIFDGLMQDTEVQNIFNEAKKEFQIN